MGSWTGENMEEMLRGQVEVHKCMFGFVDSMALKCAVELRLADIINSHGSPLSLSQIASKIDSPSPDVSYLQRVMRMLVCKGVFTEHHPADGGKEILYGLNNVSRWLLTDAEVSMAPFVLMVNHPSLHTSWHNLSHSVREGGIPFKRVHGCNFWEFQEQNPEFNKLFNDCFVFTAKIIVWAFLERYRDRLDDVRVLVDVGGATGATLAEIVKALPHIEGINFDRPQVVATAPTYNGISQVGGNMFEFIPSADAVFMKYVLHGWGDENCVKILRNCRKAIPEKTGKLILVDLVLQTDGSNNKLFGDMDLVIDLLLFAHTTGGKVRTEEEWKKLLEEGGFPRYKIIEIPALASIIEAYPE